MFRLLKANEIDCRVQSVTEKGVILLLYKDARCDMNILDETSTVGPMRWKREHSRDNANCTVSIWSDEMEQWVSKEDTGTESNTEKAKGLASDSFKRACFNWGIGRELYTAPFTWISADKCSIQKDGTKFKTYDKFEVLKIGYDNNKCINALEIVNSKTKVLVFKLGSFVEPTNQENKNTTNPNDRNAATEKVTTQQLIDIAIKKGFDEAYLCKKAGTDQVKFIKAESKKAYYVVLQKLPDKV